MSTNIEHLFELCKEQPFNIEKIKNYIIDNKMNSEQVTRVAIKLCNYGVCSYSEYLYQNEKEPLPGDLITYNWEELFDVLVITVQCHILCISEGAYICKFNILFLRNQFYIFLNIIVMIHAYYDRISKSSIFHSVPLYCTAFFFHPPRL